MFQARMLNAESVLFLLAVFRVPTKG